VIDRLKQLTMQGEAELRSLYASCGISPEVTERAVKTRYHTPPEEQYVDGRGKFSPTKLKKRGRHAKK
jgi:hypothetical protein